MTSVGLFINISVKWQRRISHFPEIPDNPTLDDGKPLYYNTCSKLKQRYAEIMGEEPSETEIQDWTTHQQSDKKTALITMVQRAAMSKNLI